MQLKAGPGRAVERLRASVESLLEAFDALPATVVPPTSWGPREVLAHLVAWHEVYARTLASTVAGREPDLSVGTFAEINQAAVRASEGRTAAQLCAGFRRAQREIERMADAPALRGVRLQVKRDSTPRSIEGFLDRASAHIDGHAADLRRDARRSRRTPEPPRPIPAGPPTHEVIERLLASGEPSVRLWILTDVLDRLDTSSEVRTARADVQRSARVATLLSERRRDGTLPYHPYRAKWYGAHWVLVALAELGYPPGDESLRPLLDQVLTWLHSPDYLRSIGTVKHLPRMHASIDANAVWAARVLGIDDPRVEPLVDRLLGAQWPDGGWNCDRDASGRTASFTESLIPLRALSLHARTTGDRRSAKAAGMAAEFFLARRLHRRLRDGEVISSTFTQLHYPCYWHYDILFGLRVMREAGFLHDSRCSDALDLLQSKRMVDGGYPAEHRYYRPTRAMVPSQRSLVDWGGTRRFNPWITALALGVLHVAGRVRVERTRTT